MLEPHADTHAAQALGHKLQLAVFAAGVMDLHQGAVFRQAFGVEVARVIRGRVDKKQRQGVMGGFADQFQGLGPGFFIDDDRQHLCREERPIVNRNDVNLVRQILLRQCQFSPSRMWMVFGFSVFYIGVLSGVVRKLLLVAHGAPAQLGMDVRWGAVPVVSMVNRFSCVRRRNPVDG